MALLQSAIDEVKGAAVKPCARCRLNMRAAQAILARGLPPADDGVVDDEVRREWGPSQLAALAPPALTQLAKKWRRAYAAQRLPPALEAYLKLHLLQALGRRLSALGARPA